jgi:hypothetical protein
MKKELEPMQQGLSSGGCESINHDCQRLVDTEPDAHVATLDASNAFNAIFRKNVADAAHQREKLKKSVANLLPVVCDTDHSRDYRQNFNR